MQRLIRLILERPIVGLLVGLPFSLAFLWLAVHSYGEVQRFESGPRDATLEQAIDAARAGDAYVRIPSGVVDCAAAVFDESSAYLYAPLRGADGAYVGMLTAEGRACPEPAEGLVGVLHATNERKAARLAGTLPPEALAYDLCTYCGSANSTLGLYLGAGLSVVALLLYPLALFGRRSRERRGAAGRSYAEHTDAA